MPAVTRLQQRQTFPSVCFNRKVRVVVTEPLPLRAASQHEGGTEPPLREGQSPARNTPVFKVKSKHGVEFRGELAKLFARLYDAKGNKSGINNSTHLGLYWNFHNPGVAITSLYSGSIVARGTAQ